jgi:cytochrome b
MRVRDVQSLRTLLHSVFLPLLHRMPHTHSLHRIRIWDLPTRGFHVLLALSVAGLIATGEIGAMQLHFWLGYGVLTLVLFRLVWGFVGGHWSRFINFVPTPAKLRAYVQAVRTQQAPHSVGHNPLGALSVLCMLSLLLLQVFSGFISDDEIANTGPWAALVPANWMELATEYHSDIGKVLLILLIVLHVGTVLYYKRIKHDDLITPMITGDKVFTTEVHASRDTRTSRLFALSVLAGCAYVVYRLVNLA